MPGTIHHDPRYPRGVYYCKLRLLDGRITMRSTGTRDRTRAKIICDAWQQAETEAGGGDLTRDRVTRILNETLERLGHERIERVSIEHWLNE